MCFNSLSPHGLFVFFRLNVAMTAELFRSLAKFLNVTPFARFLPRVTLCRGQQFQVFGLRQTISVHHELLERRPIERSIVLLATLVFLDRQLHVHPYLYLLMGTVYYSTAFTKCTSTSKLN